MFDIEIKNISRIVENVVGKPYRGTNIDGWTEYDCPYCSDMDGVDFDGKHNCCINYREGYFHCWKCGEAGKISKVLRDYGGSSVVREYYEEIRNIRNSQEYQLYSDNLLVKNELVEVENEIRLPENFRLISSVDKQSYPAYKYLKERGLNYNIINQFGIGYVPWSDNYKMRCRVIIPSYDQYRNLNYYIARDYTGKQKLKYINPEFDKKKIIFNECKVNWGETVTLVEGVMDSLVIPNSIPLLGKTLDDDNIVYHMLMERARANINILLDDDAEHDAKQMYVFLNKGVLKDRIRFIGCPQGYDASLLYQHYGKKGVLGLMRSARKLNDYEML